MAQYTVEIACQPARVYADIEIEADSEQEADEKAWDMINSYNADPDSSELNFPREGMAYPEFEVVVN